ncbi:MAG: ATP-grasp domain-containing protein [Ardenticatenaceae bacterium]
MAESDVKKIGLIVGREWSWPPAFIDEVNSRDEEVIAEYVKLGGTRMNEPCPYAVIVDRISHEIPYYRSYLKNAILQGCYVINNPFMWAADDKFFEASLATKLGVVSPRTILLPNKDYVPGVVPESLRNLEYPLDWQAIVDYVGLPAILKDAHGGGWKEVYKIDNIDELIFRYDQSGRLQMILQEFIEWEHYVRCLCINQSEILPMKYDPRERRYHVEHAHLTPELGARIVSDSQTLCQALGYDMNTVEFAVRDGVPYAIDFMNPAPDMDIYSLTPFYFDWAVNKMADMCIEKAQQGAALRDQFRWAKYLPED